MEIRMMMQFSQEPKMLLSDMNLEAWRSYVKRITQAVRERREDAYEAMRDQRQSRLTTRPRRYL
jgi:hypothetical protein